MNHMISLWCQGVVLERNAKNHGILLQIYYSIIHFSPPVTRMMIIIGWEIPINLHISLTAEGDSHPIALIAMSDFHRFIPSWFLKAGSQQQWDRDSSCFNRWAGLLPTVWILHIGIPMIQVVDGRWVATAKVGGAKLIIGTTIGSYLLPQNMDLKWKPCHVVVYCI